MHDTLLELLRCPFCGTRLSLVDSQALTRDDDRVESGVLGCECCAFPIVAGIPVLIADNATRDAMHALEAGRGDEALCALLGLDEPRAARFLAMRSGARWTFRDAIELLSPDPEGTYFLYRFSDPTFRVAEALVRTIGRSTPLGAGRRLDLCGGSGHLTRVLAGLDDGAWPGTVVADLHFWKLWLATRFTAPGCAAVCCDAEAPLPFSRDLFSMVVLADAFPYIWHKRLCAQEMMRVSDPGGVVLMPHLHSAHGENVSAGDPLSPSAYLELFAPFAPRLFSDARLFESIVDRQVVDLSRDQSPDQIGAEPSLTLVAGEPAALGPRRDVPESLEVTGELVVNPLYTVTRSDGRSVLTLRFPTPDYEAEFGACRRYLPDTITVDGDLTRPFDPALLGGRYAELRRRRVLLDVPPRYCPWPSSP